MIAHEEYSRLIWRIFDEACRYGGCQSRKLGSVGEFIDVYRGSYRGSAVRMLFVRTHELHWIRMLVNLQGSRVVIQLKNDVYSMYSGDETDFTMLALL